MDINAGWTPPDATQGDRLTAQEVASMSPPPPLVIRVREHRTGIKTQYNPNGDGSGVVVDVANVATGDIYIDVLWMNGAVVDKLSASVGDTVAAKLQYVPSQSGGNPYITVVACEAQELTLAQQWAAKSADPFEEERARRQQPQQQPAAAPQQPATPQQSVAQPQPQQPQQQQPQQQPAAQPQQQVSPQSAQPPGGNPLDDPAVQALIAQYNQNQQGHGQQ